MRYEKLDSKLVFSMSEDPHQIFTITVHTLTTGAVTGKFNIDEIDALSEEAEVKYIELVSETGLVVLGRTACQCKCGCCNEDPLSSGKCDFCSVYYFDEVDKEHRFN